MSYAYTRCSLNWIQGVIVSSAVFGAAAGSALGGALGDFAGRKKTLLVGDVLFAVGALLMAAAQGVGPLIAGRPCCIVHLHHLVFAVSLPRDQGEESQV